MSVATGYTASVMFQMFRHFSARLDHKYRAAVVQKRGVAASSLFGWVGDSDASKVTSSGQANAPTDT